VSSGGRRRCQSDQCRGMDWKVLHATLSPHSVVCNRNVESDVWIQLSGVHVVRHECFVPHIRVLYRVQVRALLIIPNEKGTMNVSRVLLNVGIVS
jgi:hypothetical protein